MSHTVSAAQQTRQRRATAGAFVGTAIEWYDFFIFGTAAALVFGPVFFPAATPAVGVLASFATFWVGFLARPLGGILFGHLGDRFGRKNTLVATLLLMGSATTLIGVLPGYATIGVLAPVLLVVLRALQGLAVGGEWAGATLMATESATAEKRGWAGAWVQQGSPAGSILATLMFLLVGGLPDDQFLSWGWRVPFLVSALLLIVALLIRMKVEESDDFETAKSQGEVVKLPIAEVFRTAPAFIWLGMAACVLGIAVAFFNNTFLLSWTTGELGMPRRTILNVLLIAAVVQFIWQPIAALIAERIGALKVMIGGLVFNLILIVPLFLAIMSRDVVMIGLVLCLAILGGTAYYALLSSFLTQAFPPNVRFTGVALANGLCASVIGGSTPLIAQSLLNTAGPWGVAGFYALIAIVTIFGVWALHRRMARRDAETLVAGRAAAL